MKDDICSMSNVRYRTFEIKPIKMKEGIMDIMSFYFEIEYFGNGKHPISPLKENFKETSIPKAANFKLNNEVERDE
ncbi:MAG: hypothetical protein ACFE9X_05780 [Promethearchaeota archaeon]